MRKIWTISMLAFAVIAMAACASMYDKQGERVFRARGTVAAYEPGKMIKLQAGQTEMLQQVDSLALQSASGASSSQKTPILEYTIVPDTEVHGDVKPGKRVLIRYTQKGVENPQATARSIDAVFD